jgi:hypothetical protein
MMIEALREAIIELPATDLDSLLRYMRRLFTPDEMLQILAEL